MSEHVFMFERKGARKKKMKIRFLAMNHESGKTSTSRLVQSVSAYAIERLAVVGRLTCPTSAGVRYPRPHSRQLFDQLGHYYRPFTWFEP